MRRVKDQLNIKISLVDFQEGELIDLYLQDGSLSDLGPYKIINGMMFAREGGGGNCSSHIPWIAKGYCKIYRHVPLQERALEIKEQISRLEKEYMKMTSLESEVKDEMGNCH